LLQLIQQLKPGKVAEILNQLNQEWMEINAFKPESPKKTGDSLPLDSRFQSDKLCT
jgi:hypothetical protein